MATPPRVIPDASVSISADRYNSAAAILEMTVADVNGAAYDVNPAGEDLKAVFDNDMYVRIPFPPNYPEIKDGMVSVIAPKAGNVVTWVDKDGTKRAFDTPVITPRYARDFLATNYRHLVECGRPSNVAAICAASRLELFKSGYISPDFKARDHHCYVNDCVKVAKAVEMTDEDFKTAFGASVAVGIVKTKKLLRDFLAYTAFSMRQRGHHYGPRYDELYTNLHEKCLHERSSVLLDWVDVSRTIMHAIFPDTLDHIWLVYAANKLCSGGMCKRVDTAAAGTAAIKTVYIAVCDLVTVFPSMPEAIGKQFEELFNAYSGIADDRWAGSVNHHLYGSVGFAFNESKVAGLASATLSMLKIHAPSSRMLTSNALERVAKNAPITGALYARVLDAAFNASIAAGTAAGRTIEVRHPEVKGKSALPQITDITTGDPDDDDADDDHHDDSGDVGKSGDKDGKGETKDVKGATAPTGYTLANLTESAFSAHAAKSITNITVVRRYAVPIISNEEFKSVISDRRASFLDDANIATSLIVLRRAFSTPSLTADNLKTLRARTSAYEDVCRIVGYQALIDIPAALRE